MGRKEKTLLITLGANAILVALIFALAALSGSRALQANAWHAASDLFVGLFVLTGMFATRLLEKSVSRRVTLIENMASLVVAALIFGVAYEIFVEAIRGAERELRNVPQVTLISLLTIALCYFISRYRLYVGEQTGSSSLTALGYHSRVDVYTATIVVTALLGYMIGLTGLDRAAAVVIVLLIARTGWEILTTAAAALLIRSTVAEVHGRAGLGEELLGTLEQRWQDGRIGVVNYLGLRTVVTILARIGRGAQAIADFVRSRRLFFFRLALLAALIVYFLSGLHVIRWNEHGVVRRLGRMVAVERPGLHYRLPPPIDRLDRVRVQEIKREEITGLPLLTGDTNIVESTVAIHYSIRSASDYLFNTVDPQGVLVDALKVSLTEALAATPIDAALTTERTPLESRLLDAAQQVLDSSRSGMQLVALQIAKVWPPADTIEAFRDVASAREDKVTYVNEAEKEYNRMVPEARGEAAQQVSGAEGYRSERVLQAEGEGGRFMSQLRAYRTAPSITRKRLYLETMERMLPGVKKYVVDAELLPGSTTDLWFLESGQLIKPAER